MGIETIVTCDQCGTDISDLDHASIEVRFEIDHNREPLADVRSRSFGIYCLECGEQVKARIFDLPGLTKR